MLANVFAFHNSFWLNAITKMVKCNKAIKNETFIYERVFIKLAMDVMWM